MGSTGEGPAFTRDERERVLAAAAEWRAARSASGFHLLAGTGFPALGDSIQASRDAFALGLDGVLLLPPYFFKPVDDAGLADWFERVLDAALPATGRAYLYHIPRLSGLPITPALIERLAARAAGRLAGIKDSGGDLAWSLALLERFPDLDHFTGSDGHLLPCLRAGGAGAITALASLRGDLARAVWDAWQAGDAARASAAQDRLGLAREAFDQCPSVAAVKAMVAELHGLPRWPLRPPLRALGAAEAGALARALGAIG